MFRSLFPGLYLGSVCQRWTFPKRLTALLGSCVEVPCTYDPGERLGASSPVWYLYHFRNYLEILNTKDASSIEKNYKDRTSLVPGNNSCTLRIDPVTEDDADKYHPGIAEDKETNAYDKQGSGVQLTVTDKVNYDLSVPGVMTEGDATIMSCAVIHTCGSSPPSLRWNKPGTVNNKSVELTYGSWREESVLTYIPSYVDDGTPVQCTAIYLHDQYNISSRKLNIDYAPKNVTVAVIGTYEVKEGDDVTLKCNCTSKTRIVTYEWYKGKGKTKLMDSKQTITVKNMTKDMELYGCAAINHVGRGESDLIEIQVRYAATEVHVIVKNDRESTELTCVFLSSWPDVTHYTWMKNGTIVPNENKKTLILENNEERYGEYLCIAHNKAGNSSSEEILIERQYPIMRFMMVCN
ncbi:hypothetical protein GDO78_020274 [Eleutherodactylus coqui]|uniref:Ig-like domain-containing protein n=1 Tax=Eleutherodactylus coqui TaxID=57060 RepID=A0A8J6B6V7_ELECQ|nr:hypothetical protein GDO78_020274 [Eleutherodactylus coqui]